MNVRMVASWVVPVIDLKATGQNIKALRRGICDYDLRAADYHYALSVIFKRWKEGKDYHSIQHIDTIIGQTVRGVYADSVFETVTSDEGNVRQSLSRVCILLDDMILNAFISALIGAFIGYLLILPGIGMISPITFAGILIVAAVVGCISSDPFWGKVAIALLAIQIFRTVSILILVRKYPQQTLMMDADYQRR